MKANRHAKILDIIREFEIENQQQLQEKLLNAGVHVTQATISRDVRELQLIKIPASLGPDKRQRYGVIQADRNHEAEKYLRVFRDAVIAIDYGENMVVIHTLVGMAMAVAASLDAMNRQEIVGSIAGDDNVFCLTKSKEKALELMGALNDILRPRGVK